MTKEEMEISLIKLKKKKIDVINYINENFDIFVAQSDFSRAWNDTAHKQPKHKEIRIISERLIASWLNG